MSRDLTPMINSVASFNGHDILGDMGNGTEIEKVLAEAAEKIRREAYAAGWQAAIAAINKAATELADPAAIPSAGDVAPLDFSSSGGAPAANGIKMGSTPWYVLQAVRKRPGMTGSEVVDVVTQGGHKVPDGLVRTSLARLGNKKLIVSRHRKWFPA
jgi:hypothetical protein